MVTITFTRSHSVVPFYWENTELKEDFDTILKDATRKTGHVNSFSPSPNEYTYVIDLPVDEFNLLLRRNKDLVDRLIGYCNTAGIAISSPSASLISLPF